MDFGFSLTTRLPFDDDEFDHIHMQSIATGVPENKVCAVVFSFVRSFDRLFARSGVFLFKCGVKIALLLLLTSLTAGAGS